MTYQHTLALAFAITLLLLLHQGCSGFSSLEKISSKSHSLVIRSSSSTTENDVAVLDEQRPLQDESDNVVKRFLDAFNRRDMDGFLSCFAENCLYEDTLFQNQNQNQQNDGGNAAGSTCRGRAELRAKFQPAMDWFPADIQVALDQVAVDSVRGTIGAQWHLELNNVKNPLPFSRGCSFYTLQPETGLIETGFRVAETPFKPDYALFDLLIAPQKIMEQQQSMLFGSESESKKDKLAPQLQAPQWNSSMIAQVYDAYNAKNAAEAARCFTENVQFQDTLYWARLEGRAELQRHFERVAAQLPAACTIQIDNLAESDTAIGVQWHLEVDLEGIGIPTLMPMGIGSGVATTTTTSPELLPGWSRGVSMYTKDATTGLLSSGFDVTEPAPFLKINQSRLNQITSPLQSIRYVLFPKSDRS